MTPYSVSFSWPIVLPLLLAWSSAAYWAGDHNRNNAWLAKQAAVEQQARLDYASEVVRGQVAASQSISEQQKLQANYSQLEEKFNELVHRGPLVVYKYKAPVVTQPALADVPLGSQAATTARPVPGAAADGDVALSLGAVWLWNSALTGTDTPAGACGAADTAKPACAADSGLRLEAAWANHAINAKSCAVDRLRHQKLIDYVKSLPTTPNGPTHGF